MKNRIRKMAAVLVTFAVCFNYFTIPANATPTQDKLNQVNSNINNINNQKNQAEQQANEINQEIIQLMASVQLLESQLEEKQAEVAQVQAQLADAQEKEQSQTIAMKARIKSIYEKGNTAYLTSFLESKNFADLINKMEYASTVYEYDKTNLERLQQVRAEVQELETKVVAEEAELQGLVNECNQEKYYLEIKLANVKSTIKDYETKLAAAQKQAATYKKQIEEENERIRKQQEEQAKKNAANNSGSSGSGSSSGGGTNFSSDGSVGAQVVEEALKYVGNKYVWGGNSLENGIDCSGFTKAIFAKFGVSLPRYSGDQGKCGVEVSYSEARAGDLIWYSGHVAIYMGNGKIVHASNSAPYPAGGIKVSSATYTTILSIRRLV